MDSPKATYDPISNLRWLHTHTHTHPAVTWTQLGYLATGSPLWPFVVSCSLVIVMFYGFCWFPAFTFDFQEKRPLDKMDSLNEHGVRLMTTAKVIKSGDIT